MNKNIKFFKSKHNTSDKFININNGYSFKYKNMSLVKLKSTYHMQFAFNKMDVINLYQILIIILI